LIAFCEERKLTELASGLKQELKTVRKSSSATFKPISTKPGSAANLKVKQNAPAAPLDKDH